MVGGAWIRALLHRRKPQWTRNPGLHACAHTHHMIRTHARTHPRSHKPTRCRAYTDLTLCRARSARISHPSGSFILLGHVHHFPPLSSAGSLTTALFHFVPYRMHALSSLSSRAYFPLIPPDTLHPSRSLFLSLTTLYALPHSSFLRPVTYPLARNFFLSFTLSLTRSFPVLLVLVYSRSPASSTRVRPLLALLAFFQSLGRPTRLLRGLSSLVFLLFFPPASPASFHPIRLPTRLASIACLSAFFALRSS